ncbi:TPA: hypothetical protein U5D93_003466 [Yersinia enterocolitica]|nr:hypothetical protein [Yersinia enterocolitica]HDL8420898.1 hypothetical protein [Yersinia enterocolitica]HEN3302885.1 hypothetical protein [Yersinia enterocolitica]HEN3393345.1 hypothetical protein [Yersinia enterocolitica]
MANYVIPAIGDDIPATQKGIQFALQKATQHGCNLILLVPSIKNAEESNMLEQILGEDLLKKLAKKRESVTIGQVNIRIEALSTLRGSQLSTFDGVILGLWITKHDAITLSEIKPPAKDIILVQWSEDELTKWAEYNNATYI